MTGRSNCYIRKIVFSLLILSGLTLSLYSQDEQIGGIVNVYRQVVAIGTDNVTLNNTDSILAGDYVLLIQMQGVGIVTDQNGYGGTVQTKFGEPGGYEFLKVLSVNTGTKEVLFTTSKLINTYDITGNVQLIKVPFYNTATVTSTLTSMKWDKNSKTGGVVAMIVGRKLKLNAPIDVSGKGFLGGQDTNGIGECVEVDFTANNHDSYPETWMNAGYKGEGLAIHDEFGILLAPLHVKGQGINFTSGGGGNGKFSGGGGGSNRGRGGDGGTEIFFGPEICPIPYSGAYGGTTVASTVISGGIFMGGGGGSSTHAVGSTGSSGGNGGGIVIIVTDTISGNRNFIKADGVAASDASGNAGAGGGGAGGSIVLTLRSFSNVTSDSLKLSVKGGKGGINPAGYGAGGGGGGGLAWFSLASIPLKVPVKIDYGLPGPIPTSAGNGEIKYNFVPKLNGFLFNSIISSVTGDRIDSVCSTMLPPKILGTKPVGGTTPYTYLWEKSYDELTWDPLVNDADPTNYTPALIETSTVYYRRTITDSDPIEPIVDVSKSVEIIVQPAITGNLVGKDTTICYGQDPLSLVPQNAGPSNGSSLNYYFFKWIQNNTDTGWDSSPTATGTYTDPGYDPPALTETTYYQRVVTSGRCIDYSATVTITVLPSITGNTITQADEVICEGSLFTDLNATAAGGGDNAYLYQWQDSIAGSLNFLPAVGTNTGSIYSPDTSTFLVEEQRYLRRVVFSGPDSVCQDRSNPILLTRYHKIENNTITADQTICSGSIPASLAGSIPAAGNLSYTYEWQDSTKTGTWITRGTSDFSFAPPALTDTTWYRRKVFSSVCTNASLPIIVNVHKPILNNNITLIAGSLTDTTICSGAIPNILKGPVATGGTDLPGDYVYQWLVSTDDLSWNPVPSAGTGLDYQPPSLLNTTYYRRQVVSGTCMVVSNSIKITVLPLISNNIISSNQTVCYDAPPAALTGVALSGGDGATYTYAWEESSDGTTWTPASTTTGVNNAADYTPPALTSPMKYKRVVTSGLNGCCISISNIIDIGIYALPTGQITNIADTTICGGAKTNINIHLTGAAPWIVTIGENALDRADTTINSVDAIIPIFPASPAALNNFTYQISKLVDNNGCIATSLSGDKKAIVYQTPIANAGIDADTCGPTYILKAIPTAGTGTWSFPSALVSSTVNNPSSVTVTIDSTFTGNNISHWFYWEEVNWQCVNKDSVNITFDKRIDYIVNAGRDTTISSRDNEMVLVADPVLYGSGMWSLVSGSGFFDNDSSNVTKVIDLDVSNIFKWTVTNGQCSLSDIINVSWMDDYILPKGFSPNGDGVNDIYIIRGLDLSSRTAEFRIVNSAGTEVFSTSSTPANKEGWENWDGKNSRGIDLPEGTYYCILKTKSGDNPWEVKNGFIILKRY